MHKLLIATAASVHCSALLLPIVDINITEEVLCYSKNTEPTVELMVSVVLCICSMCNIFVSVCACMNVCMHVTCIQTFMHAQTDTDILHMMMCVCQYLVCEHVCSILLQTMLKSPMHILSQFLHITSLPSLEY